MESIADLIKQLLEMTAWPMTPPKMYGPFHLCFIIFAIVIALLLSKIMMLKQNKTQIKFLAILGWIMIFLEVYKQLFYYFVVNNSHYDWWWFPFQLCSIPMYLCILLPFINENKQHLFYTFLSTYTLLGTIAAFLYPQDMLRGYVTMTLHAFIWHALLLTISMTVIRCKLADPSRRTFFQSTYLFLFFCILAEVFNTIGTSLGSSPDLFYISPYVTSTFSLYESMQNTIGIIPGDIVYIILVILGSAGLQYTYYRYTCHKHND